MIVLNVFNWQFRVFGNGSFESRNEKLGKDWAIRSASDCGLDASRYWYIKNQIEQVSRVFPDEPVPPPSSEPVEVGVQEMREKVLASESQAV